MTDPDAADELDRVKAERDRLLQDSRDLTDANTDFRRDMWTLSKERQDAIDELAKAEAEIAELRETLEHVQGSDVTLMELLAAEKRKTEHWRAEAKNMLVSGRKIAESIAAQRDALKIRTDGQFTYTRISDCPNCRTWTNEAAHQCAVCEGRSIAMQVSQFDPQSVADTAIIVASGETTTDMGTSFAIGTQPTPSPAPAGADYGGLIARMNARLQHGYWTPDEDCREAAPAIASLQRQLEEATVVSNTMREVTQRQLTELETALAAARDENARLSEQIALQRAWHEAEDKALSKSGRSDADYYWRRDRHLEQIEALKAAQSDAEYDAAFERINARADAAYASQEPDAP